MPGSGVVDQWAQLYVPMRAIIIPASAEVGMSSADPSCPFPLEHAQSAFGARSLASYPVIHINAMRGRISGRTDEAELK